MINLSKGGAKFLSHNRLTPGKNLLVKLNIPGRENSCEIMADVRWISRNPEQSYKVPDRNIISNPLETAEKKTLNIFWIFLQTLNIQPGSWKVRLKTSHKDTKTQRFLFDLVYLCVFEALCENKIRIALKNTYVT